MLITHALSAQLTAPFTESFDATTIPTNWTQSATTGGPWVFDQSFTWSTGVCPVAPSDHTGNGGNYAALDFSDDDAGVILTLPDVDVNGLTAPELSFYHYTCGEISFIPFNPLYVEAFDGTSYTVILTVAAGTATWQRYNVLLAPYVLNGEVQLRFRAESSGDTNDRFRDIALDDVSVIEAPACPSLNTITATNPTANTVDLNWTAVTGVASYDYLIVPSGTAVTNATPESGNTTATSITATVAQTGGLDAYVRSRCSASEVSDWRGPAYFRIAPVNDECASATTLTINPDGACQYTPVSTLGATQSLNIPDPPFSNNDDVWYEITPTTSTIRISYQNFINRVAGTSGLGYALYSGCNESDLQVRVDNFGDPVAGSGSQTIPITLTPNTTYYLLLYLSGGFSEGTFDICLEEISCTLPQATASLVTSSCPGGVSIEVDLTDLGSATTVSLTNSAGVATVTATATGTYTIGPFSPAAINSMTVTAEHDTDPSCNLPLGQFFIPPCPPQGCAAAEGTRTLYEEEFDDATNDWTGDEGPDNGDWQYLSGGTPSSDTGPSGAFSGAGYVYYEASGDASNTAILTSPAIDLSGETTAELSFYMHANGADMGTFELKAATDLSGTFSSIFTIGGQRHANENAAWSQVGVDISSYAGGTLYLRMEHTGTGGGFAGDFSVDALRITSCFPLPTNDECAAAIALSMSTEGSCQYTAVTTLTATQSVNLPSPFSNNDDVWYSFTPTTSTVRFNYQNLVSNGLGGDGVGYGLYDACGGTLLLSNDNFGDPGTGTGSQLVPYTFTSGTTYYVALFLTGEFSEGTFDFCAEDINCTLPQATATLVAACPNDPSIEINLTNLGNATSVTISNSTGSTPITATATGIYTIGPLDPAAVSGVEVTVTNDQNTICVLFLDEVFVLPCPPVGVNCPSTSDIVGFLYEEAFDDASNAWTGDEGTADGDWQYRAGGTISSGTGPSGAFNGAGYVHYEASGNAMNTAVLTSPAIDLTAESAAELSFYFHANGADMGTFELKAATDPSGSFTSIFTIGGQRHADENAAWSQVGIDISSYAGSLLYLRMEHTGSGTGFAGDFSVDYLRIETCTPQTFSDTCADAPALALSTPGSCQYTAITTVGSSQTTSIPDPPFSNNDEVWVSITPTTATVRINYQNFVDVSNTNSLGLGYALYDACGNPPTVTPLVRVNNFGDPMVGTGSQTVPYTLVPGTTYYLMLYLAGNGSAGTFDLCVEEIGCTLPQATVSLVPDNCSTGVSFEVDLTSLGSASSITIANNAGAASTTATAVGTYTVGPFDYTTTGNVIITLGQSGTPGCELVFDQLYALPCPSSGPNCASTPGRSSVVYTEAFDDAANAWTGDEGTGDGEWQYGVGGTPTNNTGPSGRVEGNGYVYYEASGNATTTAALNSPAIDLTNNSVAELSFFFHANGADIGTFSMQAAASATGPFTTIFTISGQRHADEAAPWSSVGVDLSSYVGGMLYLRMQHTGTGTGEAGDFSVDQLRIEACTDPPVVALPTNACSPQANAVVDGTAGGFVDILDAGGAVIASISTTVDLGFVAAQVYGYDGATRIAGGAYMDRNVTIVPDNSLGTGTATVRLYFTDTEMQDLVDAGAINAAGDALGINKVSGTMCSVAYPGGGQLIPSTNVAQYDGSDWVVTFTVDSFSEFFVGGITALPAEFTKFTAEAEALANRLDWTTATELNVDFFAVERSTNGSDWIDIGTVKAIGNSTVAVDYQYLDRQPLATTYYRLRTVDLDGYMEYSDVVQVTRPHGTSSASLTPNPTKGEVTLTLDLVVGEEVIVTVTDIAGRVVSRTDYTLAEGLHTLDIDLSDRASGIYFVQLQSRTLQLSERLLKD